MANDKYFNDCLISLLPYLESVARNRYKWADPEDLAQETAFKALRSQHQFKVPPGWTFKKSLKCWLSRILHNQAMSIWRKDRRIEFKADFSRDLRWITPATQENHVFALQAIDLLSTIPRHMASAIVQLGVEERRFADLQNETGTPQGTFKSRATRGRQLMAQKAGLDRDSGWKAA